MSLPSTAALVALQDANGAVNNQANGATAFVTPGGSLKFSLQSTTGVSVWTITLQCPNFPQLHNVPFYWYNGQANLIQIPTPPGAFQCTYGSTVSDGQQSIQTATGQLIGKGSQAVPVQHVARLATLAALASYTIANGVITITATGALASIDSVTPATGDLILLTLGAAAADNGLYQVTNAGGVGVNAVLTRAPDWQNGSLLLPGTTVEVSEGTVFGPSTWKVTTTGNSTVGTTSVALYPRLSSGVTAAGSGSVAATVAASVPMFIVSTATVCIVTQNTSGGTAVAQIPTMTAGLPGTAKVSLAVGGSDTSKYNVTAVNF